MVKWFKNQVTGIELKIRTAFVPSASVTIHRKVCRTARHVDIETGEKFHTSHQVVWRDRHYDIITPSSIKRVLRVQYILAERIFEDAEEYALAQNADHNLPV